MTTYNSAAYLPDQLATIAAQSRLPHELIVSDDASTDATMSALREFAANAPMPVRLIRQPRNVGVLDNVARAAASTSGDVVVFADADDLWAPEKVDAVFEAFTDPDVALWFSDADLVDERGRSLGRTTWEAVNLTAGALEEIRSGRGLRRLLYGQTVTGATMAVRGSVLDIAWPVPEVVSRRRLYLHDGWIAVLAHLRGRIVAEPRQLTAYRQHPKQVTSMSMNPAGCEELPHAPAERDPLTLDQARVAAIAGRVRATSTSADWRTAQVNELLDLERFLATRVSPQGPMRRRAVFAELRRGAYRRHARGLRTALKDLAFAPSGASPDAHPPPRRAGSGEVASTGHDESKSSEHCGNAANAGHGQGELDRFSRHPLVQRCPPHR